MSAGFRCLVCGEGIAEPVLVGCRDYYLREPVLADYHRCLACGLLQQFPRPSDTSLFYAEYPVHEPKSTLYDLFRRLLMGAVYYDPAPHPKGSVLLDYGCGDGAYLDSLKGRGFELVGYEHNSSHADSLSRRLGLPVFNDPEELLRVHRGRVDALTMHFVLEHLTDLDAAFSEVHDLLRPGGAFHYVVPHHASFEARLFGRKWHNLDPPRHISFPDGRAARLLAARHGFRLVAERPVPFPNGFAASLSVVLSGRFRFPLFALFLPLGIVFARLVPTGNRTYHLIRE